MQNSNDIIDRIFSMPSMALPTVLEVFRFQYNNNRVYKDWCDAMGVDVDQILDYSSIPFLPISFFKTHKVVCGGFEPELVFESSGTTGMINSKHYVRYENIYQKSFVRAFELFYGPIKNYCIIGLLPNYLEKGNSSLVKMTHDLIALSGHEKSGFYLYEHNQLATLLQELENKAQKTLLLGVSFALLDFAENFSMNLHHTLVMDTGGMKGRKKELTREQMHGYLTSRLGVKVIHSEYGMTELLSQAYSLGNGHYLTPPWMKVLVRDETDPLEINREGKGLINIIDLANIYSCSFIATQDVGVLNFESFEILGRLDNSDLRGCSLLVAP